jgi:hypothetical protein
MKDPTRWLLPSAAFVFSSGIALALCSTPVDAAQGHRPAARAAARTNVNRPQARPAASRPAAPQRQAGSGASRDRAAGISRDSRGSVSRDISRDRNVNVNRNRDVRRDVNINHDINIDHDIDVHHHDHDHWDDWDDHPFATAAAVTAGVAVTSAVIGSIVNSVPPSCVQVITYGTTYVQCGSTWYLPRYSGTTVQYVVVAPPR